MIPAVTEDLNKEKMSPFHEKILSECIELVKRSRTTMSRYYPDWDLQDRVFRGEKIPDLDDRKQEQKGNPQKMIVPNTYAQVMSFTSFGFLLFNQNPTFFTLEPTGDEDYGTKERDSSLVLQRDVKHNQWNTRVFQHLLDVAKFGVGIKEVGWKEEKTSAFITPDPLILNVNGVEQEVEQAGAWKEYTRFLGNEVKNVSPYRFFPDPSFPITDFRRGRYCAVEEEYPMSELYAMQDAKEVAGVDHITPLNANYAKERGAVTRWSGQNGESFRKFDSSNHNSIALVTKIQRYIVPKKYKVEGEKTLGDEEFPILFDIWYANDNRVIKCEPTKAWHGGFRWAVSQFTPDMHREINLGLADLIYMLQEVISWYVNSHITSVRRVIANRLIVDPRIIDTKTLDGEGDVYLKKGVNMPLDRAVGQLRVQDVTASHMGDADMLGKIIEMVTGVNGNAQGQYSSGRRSSYESRVVTAGAASRLKLHMHLIWEGTYSQVGRMMLMNQRQSLSFDKFQKIVGRGRAVIGPDGQPIRTPEQDIQERYNAFRGTPEEVICGDDFFIFDSTLQSEKGFMAQSLQELLTVLMSNPVAAQTWDLSPKAIFEEYMTLKGGGSVSRFSASQRIAQGLDPMPAPPPVPDVQGQNQSPAPTA